MPNQHSNIEQRQHEDTANPSPKLDPSWLNVLGDEFDKQYMIELKKFLQSEIEAGKCIRPPPKLMFNALNSTPLDRVKVVIIGQDPYFNPGEAHGLSFSVPKGVKIPSSLSNILKEASDDVGMEKPKHGCLESWAEQGVLLLNSVLTVEQGKKESHAARGWETFTNKIVEAVNLGQNNVVFILWGNYAKKKAANVDTSRHLVLTSVHPSGLSAHRGFFGSKPFSQANDYLTAHGASPIRWQIPD